MNILGISAFYHDSAACLVRDGFVVAAAQEERFTRVRHDEKFPSSAVAYCLKEARITPSELDYVIFYDKPILKFDRLLETYLAYAPYGFRSFAKALPIWLKDKLFQKRKIVDNLEGVLGAHIGWSDRLYFSEHHLSHAASAFYPSPYNSAAVLTMDGVGEWTTTSIAVGSGRELSILEEIHFPHSIGLLYSAFTYYTGFKVNSGEYKVMGLAPYGEPRYAQLIRNHLIDIRDDGSFRLNMRYFEFATGLKMTSTKFDELFGGPPRTPESDVTQREMDLAASVQLIIEEVILKIARNIAKKTKLDNLCLSGGVALNCVANGKLAKENLFKNIWVQPAAGDAGGCVGAALAFYHLGLEKPRVVKSATDGMSGSFLGPSYDQASIEFELSRLEAVYETYSDDQLIDKTARALAQGSAVGWFQGRMEFGPRSLGARSILADPRVQDMQRTLNLKVKFRESFRPFAPSVLVEDLTEWFAIDYDSPYMLFVAEVSEDKRLAIGDSFSKLFGIEKINIPRSLIPAVTHVDFTARVQTVHKETNPRYHQLLRRFKELTGCPILVNTSFNVRGEPIVCSPEDAFRCFMGTELDVLVIGNSFIQKQHQNSNQLNDYSSLYALD